MRRSLLTIGTGAAVLLMTAPHAGAQDFYQNIRKSVTLEQSTNVIEPEVAQFVAEAMRNEEPAWRGVSPDDVVTAMLGNFGTLCDAKTNSRLLSNATRCLEFANEIVALARREEDLRAFGRRLQALAARDELPVEGLRADATDFTAHAQAVLQIWKTGRGEQTEGDAPDFLTLPLSKDDLAGDAAAIGGTLAGLPREQLIAAVWRYRYGVRLVQGKRAPAFPAPTVDPVLSGTERQWLLGAWPEVEGQLTALWDRILASAGDLDLRDNQYAVLLTIPLSPDATELLGTVNVWGVVDHDDTGLHPYGDVGLRWNIATEPVLPSLTAGAAILGGAFPPTAEDGRGLCGNPLAAQGYLCRPMEATEDGPCIEEIEGDAAAITLTSCTDRKPTDRTLAGPEMCTDTEWHELSEDDKQYVCSLKDKEGRLLVACDDVCNGDDGTPNPDEVWHTYGKRPDGTLPICIREEGVEPFRYTLQRALSLADDICTLPPIDPSDPLTNPAVNPTMGCCRIVGEGNRASCQMMQDDGVFTEEDGTTALSAEGIPFTVQTCTEAMTNNFCGGKCDITRSYGEENGTDFIDEIHERAYATVGDDETCQQAVSMPDPRNQALIDSIEKRDDIGRPGRELVHTNTIGNQLCAIGSYVEDVSKRRELVGGQIPFTVFDQAFPWATDGLADEEESDTIGIDALLQPLFGSTDAGGPLPNYRPALLAKTFDIALCGDLGLPPHVPPELCILDAQRRLNLPLMTAFMTATSAMQENDDLRNAIDAAQRGAAAVGTRMINGYYGDYLHASLRSLSDVIGTTNDLLERLRLHTSPGEMCPSFPTPLRQGGSALEPAPSPTSGFFFRSLHAMKRLLIAAGTTMALLAPMGAWAQIPAACAGIRNAEPVSPYVKVVLQRAREGMTTITGARANGGFMLVFPSWVRSSFGAVAGAIDVRMGAIGIRPALLDTSTCLHLDVMQLECALAEARDALRAQITRESVLGIYRAQSLVQYLQERMLALQEGADDGTWLDVGALDPQLFDRRRAGVVEEEATPVCGDGRRQSGEECDDGNRADGDGCAARCLSEMCPYSSDYSEAIPSMGMGCDLFVLTEEDNARGRATPVISEETAALEDLMNAREQLLPGAENPEHVSVEGCVRGWCEASPDTPCGKSADCADAGGGTCVFGRRVCEGDRKQLCSNDDACGELGPCVFQADDRRTTERGAFSLEPDAFGLTEKFVELRGRQGARRSWTEAFRNPDDLPPAQRARAERLDRGDAGRPERIVERGKLRAWQELQGINEGLLFASAMDGHLRVAEELKPLRDGVRRLGVLSQDNDGVREAARNLAYYALRSCIYRPCNEKLLQVLTITFADECFPYTNGEYLTGDALAACAAAVGSSL